MTQDQALAIMKTGANVFLTGEPGSGKTHTVNIFMAWLRDHGIKAAVTAPTGVAATHIKGRTLHSWSGIEIYDELTPYLLKKITGNKRIKKDILGVQTLIIDEVSMLSVKKIEMVDAVCRAVRGNTLPFGGLQIILVGDFFQLPPIERPKDPYDQQSRFFEDGERSNFAFNSHLWETMELNVCYLEEQHRQGDSVFLDLLAAIRRNSFEPTHRTLLQSRLTRAVPPKTTQLFSHNVAIDRVNDTELSKLREDARVFSMRSSGEKRLVAQLRKYCPSPELLSLKVGAWVMFTKNDLEHRFVNGTFGVVTGFSEEEDGWPIVTTRSGEVVTSEPMDWNVEEDDRVLASVTQVPLRLAWAVSIHKSQGMTLDAAYMDLSRVFEYGQGYVALSRLTTLGGLALGGFNELALQVSPEVFAKDQEFRTASGVVAKGMQAMPVSELEKQHNEFVVKCGGTLQGVSSADGSEAKKSGWEEKLGKMREKYGNAYRPWTEEDDTRLTELFQSGAKTKQMVVVFERHPGAIRSRLKKLGLIEESL